MNRWAEYNAGTLTPPCVVQHDFVSGLHLVWVWDGSRITGPYSRKKYDEQELLDAVQTIKPVRVIEADTLQDKLEQATMEIKALQKENTSLKAQLDKIRKET